MTNFIDRGLDKMINGDKKVLAPPKPMKQWHNVDRAKSIQDNIMRKKAANSSSDKEVADYPNNECM